MIIIEKFTAIAIVFYGLNTPVQLCSICSFQNTKPRLWMTYDFLVEL